MFSHVVIVCLAKFDVWIQVSSDAFEMLHDGSKRPHYRIGLSIETKKENGLQGDGEMMPQQVGSGGSGGSRANSNGCQMHTLQRLMTHDAMGAKQGLHIADGGQAQGSCLNKMIAIWQYKI